MSDLSQITPDEAVTACNGQGIKRLAHAAYRWLEHNHEHVNSLNVFPVPDGDTGTNMLLTMQSAYGEIADSEDEHVGRVVQQLSQGALMGSRGNSGVILSQLWRGFARALQHEDEVNVASFVRGIKEASRLAYQAVQTPVEGTMLTVSREIAAAAETAADDTDDLRVLLSAVVDECFASVERTPELLPVLKEAGVVDSGGMGVAYIFEGMLRYLNGAEVEVETVNATNHQDASEPEYDPDYPYDVQFLIKGDALNVAQIRSDIEAMGDSGVIVGDPTLVKVHIHVANPGIPIGYGSEQGQLLDVVVENMYLQYLDFLKARGITMETGGDEEIERPEVEPGSIATIAIAPGEGFRRIFYSLDSAAVITGGQTMNPSTKDILEAINDIPTDKIIVLPNNKNIFMAAEQASAQAEGKQVCVLPTRTVPQGIAAQLALDPYGDIDEVLTAMEDMMSHVETGEVTTAVRDVNLDGLSVAEGQVIGLHNGTLTVAGEAIEQVVEALLDAMGMDLFELVTLYYGENIDEMRAAELAARLKAAYPEHDIEVQSGGQAHYFYIISAE